MSRFQKHVHNGTADDSPMAELLLDKVAADAAASLARFAKMLSLAKACPETVVVLSPNEKCNLPAKDF